MVEEIIYTSAPHGLKPGRKGFCTVASTPGMASTLVTLLESLSGYRHLAEPGTPTAATNPVVFSHLKARVGGRELHILSRIADAGLDYSGRSNKIAHHVVVGSQGLSPVGPAAIQEYPPFHETAWTGEPRLLRPDRALPPAGAAPDVCRYWQHVTGDAGWGGVCAEDFVRPVPDNLWLIYPQGVDMLRLLGESLALLPPAARWNATYTTFFTKLPPNVACRLRCALVGTPEAAQLRKRYELKVLDLCGSLGTAGYSEWTEAARTGVPPTARRASRQTPAAGPTAAAVARDDSGVEIDLAAFANSGPPPLPGEPPLTFSTARRRHSKRSPSERRHPWLPAIVALLLLALGVGASLAVWRYGGRLLAALAGEAEQAVSNNEDTHVSDAPAETPAQADGQEGAETPVEGAIVSKPVTPPPSPEVTATPGAEGTREEDGSEGLAQSGESAAEAQLGAPQETPAQAVQDASSTDSDQDKPGEAETAAGTTDGDTTSTSESASDLASPKPSTQAGSSTAQSTPVSTATSARHGDQIVDLKNRRNVFKGRPEPIDILPVPTRPFNAADTNVLLFYPVSGQPLQVIASSDTERRLCAGDGNLAFATLATTSEHLELEFLWTKEKLLSINLQLSELVVFRPSEGRVFRRVAFRKRPRLNQLPLAVGDDLFEEDNWRTETATEDLPTGTPVQVSARDSEGSYLRPRYDISTEWPKLKDSVVIDELGSLQLRLGAKFLDEKRGELQCRAVVVDSSGRPIRIIEFKHLKGWSQQMRSLANDFSERKLSPPHSMAEATNILEDANGRAKKRDIEELGETLKRLKDGPAHIPPALDADKLVEWLRDVRCDYQIIYEVTAAEATEGFPEVNRPRYLIYGSTREEDLQQIEAER